MDLFTEVKERANIYDVLREFGIKVDRNGRINCPFHNDHSPSCKVYEKTNSYYCYACGAGGDCVTFVQKYLNLSKIEAARWLARRYGIETDVPETAKERQERAEREDKKRKEEAWERWQNKARRTLVAYHQWLKDSRTDEFFVMDSLLEEYIRVLNDDPIMFYRLYRKELRKIEDRLRGIDSRR